MILNFNISWKWYTLFFLFLTLLVILIVPDNFYIGDNSQHLKHIQQGTPDNYPGLIYLLYPSIKMVFFYTYFIIPLLLVYLSKQVKTDDKIVIFLYFLSQVPLAFGIVGWLKQIIITIVLLLLIILYESKIHLKFKTLILLPFLTLLLYLEPIFRLKSALWFPLSKVWINMPHASLPGAFLTIFAIFITLLSNRFLLAICFIILSIMGIWETRIFASLFILQIVYSVMGLSKIWKNRRSFQ